MSTMTTEPEVATAQQHLMERTVLGTMLLDESALEMIAQIEAAFLRGIGVLVGSAKHPDHETR